MENITMTHGMVVTTGAFPRIRVECPQQASAQLLADTLGTDQGITVSAAVRIGTGVAVLAGPVAQAPIQGNGFVPFAGYAPTTHTSMDVVHIRSGRPPV